MAQGENEELHLRSTWASSVPAENERHPEAERRLSAAAVHMRAFSHVGCRP